MAEVNETTRSKRLTPEEAKKLAREIASDYMKIEGHYCDPEGVKKARQKIEERISAAKAK